jgi:predicted Zn finger-like uncharacterized protein
MSIHTSCPGCQAQFALADDVAGKKVRCTRCEHVFTAPAPGETPAAAEANDVPGDADEVPVLAEATPPEAQITAVPPAVIPRSLFPEPSTASPPSPVPHSRQAPRSADSAERGSRQKQSAGVGVILLLVGGAAVFLLLIIACAGVGGFFLLFGRHEDGRADDRVVKHAAADVPADDGGNVADARRKDGDAGPKDLWEPFVPGDPRADDFQAFKAILPFLEDKDRERLKDVFPFNPPANPAVKPPAEKLPIIPLPDRSKVPIKPPALEGDKVARPLPSQVVDVAVGGAGRFLILHLPKVRQLAIFDANEGKFVKYLPVAADNAKIAAGLDKLVVVLPDQKLIQRWNLLTFEREVTANLPFSHQLTAIAMGSASSGPLLVQSVNWPAAGEMFLFDILTMKRYDPEGFKQHLPMDPNPVMRASADGRLFGFGNRGEAAVAVITGHDVKVRRIEGQAVIPSPDGKYLYGDGVRTIEGKQLVKHNFPCLPALQGNSYLGVRMAGGAPVGPNADKGGVALYIAPESRPLLQLGDLSLESRGNPFPGAGISPLPLDRRIHLIPQAKLIVTVLDAPNNTGLMVHRFDVDDALEKSGIDYLYVASTPPVHAVQGQLYQYPIRVKSKRGGLKFTLDAGPPGMKVSPTGTLSWVVPADQPGGETDAILTIGDVTGQEIFHTFKVAVVKELPPGVRAPEEDARPPERPPEAKKVKEAEPPPKKEPEAVKVPPPAPGKNALAMIPPKLEKDYVVRQLPGSIDDLCVGGGGRFILLRLPSLRKIALFDVNEAKVVHYFPCAEDNLPFAAGMTKLVMVSPGSNTIQRWDLLTREKELTVALPAGNPVRSILMGSASEGPVLVVAGGKTFLDLKTFKPRAIQEVQGGGFPGFRGGSVSRVSADGTVFGAWEPSTSPQGLNVTILEGTTLKRYYQHMSVGHVVPGPDGKHLFTARGIFTSETRPVGKAQENAQSAYVVPAVHGDFYLNLPLGNGELYKTGFTVHLVGDERPLARVPYDMDHFARGPGVTGNEAFNHWDREVFGNDKRMLLVPDAKLLILIPFTNDRIVVKRFDIDEAMDKAGIDYLFVTSRPTATIARGKEFVYQITAKSKRGGLKYRLESGPEGMRVTPEGVVYWRVPADHGVQQISVLITVSDSAGQETFHTFKLNVVAETALRGQKRPPSNVRPLCSRPHRLTGLEGRTLC